MEDGRKPGARRSVALVQNALDYRDAICNLESFVPSMTRAKHSRSLVFKMFELFSQQAVCTDDKELHKLSYQLIQARNCVLDCCGSDAERRQVLELIDQCFVRDWTYTEYVNVKEGLLDQSKLLRLMDVNTSILNMCDAQDRSTLHGILDEGRKKLKPILDVMIAGII
ncbi:hypothetical protein HDU77_009315 [Chytriomyces hyalinus]|nr:hypothetical protein HDU77_009315 [Chytriomyces hyalinus]